MNWVKSLRNFDQQLFAIHPDMRIKVDQHHPDVRKLSIRLIKEEFKELMDAFEEENPRHIAKELVDLIYVCTQALIRLFPMFSEDIFQAVHNSNLSKFGYDAEVREDGKLLKSESYEPPNLSFIEEKF